MKSLTKIFYPINNIIGFLLLSNLSFSISLGPNFGTIFTNVPIAGSKTNWINFHHAQFSDNLEVSINAGSLASNGDYTDYLQVTDFGLNLPLTASITGITIEIQRSDVNNAKDNRVRIVKAGVIGTSDYSLNQAWNTKAYKSYGGTTELWGETWTAADLNSSNFGVAFSVKKSGGGANPIPLVDHVQITVSYTVPLPIELITFSASAKKNKGVELTWITGLEINNDYFTLEYSTNGLDFEAIKSINGAGNSSQPITYNFQHNNPNSGLNYYRLKQTDFDGKFEYFQVITIKIEEVDFKLNGKVFQTNNNEIAVQLSSDKDQQVQVSLVNLSGTLIFNSQYNLTEGNNLFTFHTNNLNTGVYIMNVNTQYEMLTKKTLISQ